MARPLVTVVVLVWAYYLLPVGRHLNAGDIWLLAVGLAVVAALLLWNIARIQRSAHPALQGVEALALVVPLFLLIFAYTYFILEQQSVSSFNLPLTRTDALYFTVTVFTTVGFGDIAPVSELARVLVTVQMLGDLVVVGVVLRIVVIAVRRARAASARDQNPDAHASGRPGRRS